MSTAQNPLAVEVKGLSRLFRGKVALEDVELSIPKGSVYGLVGINGAGKTTLIRHLIGALKPQTGSVSILGGDPIVDRVSVLRRVGYMTEEDTLPKWASVGELIDFFRGIQPKWDSDYATELCDLFGLSRRDSLSGMSKGQRARVGLLAAIAHRPELLILDEPSSGLDPIARGDILEAIIRTVNDDGRTVLFSSHLLDEVDRVCDNVAMIHGGKMVSTISMEGLQAGYREIVLAREGPKDDVRRQLQEDHSSAFGWQQRGVEWSAVCPVGDVKSTDEARDVTLNRWFAAQVEQHSVRGADGSVNSGEPSHV